MKRVVSYVLNVTANTLLFIGSIVCFARAAEREDPWWAAFLLGAGVIGLLGSVIWGMLLANSHRQERRLP